MDGSSGSVENRLDRLELESLRRRVVELSAQIEFRGKQGFRAKLKDLVKLFTPMLTPTVVALIGLHATANITAVLEERRLALSEISEARALFVELGKPDLEQDAANATAVALAAFGRPAIIPLIHELQAGRQVRPIAAERGLRALAFQHSEAVCEQLIKAIQDESRFFSWQTHERVIGLLGDIRCPDAIRPLKRFKAMLEGQDAMVKYKAIASDVSKPEKSSIDTLKRAIDRALERLVIE